MSLNIIKQDIVKTSCDVIVNSTNRRMTREYGADGSIFNAAGEELRDHLHGCLEIGEVRVTPPFNLPCKYLFHVAGPIWRGGKFNEKELLALCYKNVLKEAVALGAESIAIPLISSGTRKFPKKYVLKIAVEAIADFLRTNDIDVSLVVYDKNAYSISKELFDNITEYINGKHIEGATRMDPPERSSRSLSLPLHEWNARAFAPILSEDRPETSSPNSSAECRKPFRNNAISDIEIILRHADDAFADTLFKLIDAKRISDVECYKKANVSRQTWHKIVSDDNYRPSKTTVIAFAIALELNLNETKHLLYTAGFALSKSITFDLIIEYFISHGKYDIFEINDVLFKFDQALLGV